MSVTFNVLAATGPQLLAFFNENTGGAKVTKFRDRPTAEKRVQRLVDEMKAEELVEEMCITNPKDATKVISQAIGPLEIEADEVDHSASIKAIAKMLQGAVGEKSLVADCNNIATALLAATPKAVPVLAVPKQDVTKPWQRAKVIVCDMVSQGVTSRKEIIAACVAAGIKYNTADGAHYSIVVQGLAK